MDLPEIILPKSSIYDQSLLNEKLVREYQIAIEGMDIIKGRLSECVLSEGVNHFENCKEIRQTYFALCNDRFHGMIFPPGAEPLNRSVPGMVVPKKIKSKRDHA